MWPGVRPVIFCPRVRRGTIVQTHIYRLRTGVGHLLRSVEITIARRFSDEDPRCQSQCPAEATLLGDENLTLFCENRLVVKPQFALHVGLVDDPHALARGAFTEGKVVLMKQVTNLLLVGAYQD